MDNSVEIYVESLREKDRDECYSGISFCCNGNDKMSDNWLQAAPH